MQKKYADSLHPDYMEEARRIARFMTEHGLTQEQAAAKMGRSQSAVANKLRLLRHPAAVQEALRRLQLTERHARALLCLPEESRLAAAETIGARRLTVAQTEQYIEALLSA